MLWLAMAGKVVFVVFWQGSVGCVTAGKAWQARYVALRYVKAR